MSEAVVAPGVLELQAVGASKPVPAVIPLEQASPSDSKHVSEPGSPLVPSDGVTQTPAKAAGVPLLTRGESKRRMSEDTTGGPAQRRLVHCSDFRKNNPRVVTAHMCDPRNPRAFPNNRVRNSCRQLCRALAELAFRASRSRTASTRGTTSFS